MILRWWGSDRSWTDSCHCNRSLCLLHRSRYQSIINGRTVIRCVRIDSFRFSFLGIATQYVEQRILPSFIILPAYVNDLFDKCMLETTQPIQGILRWLRLIVLVTVSIGAPTRRRIDHDDKLPSRVLLQLNVPSFSHPSWSLVILQLFGAAAVERTISAAS